jgi:hypothetical protein
MKQARAFYVKEQVPWSAITELGAEATRCTDNFGTATPPQAAEPAMASGHFNWPMSALGQKADICSAESHVRFIPKSGPRCHVGKCPLRANSGHQLRLMAD